jgi:hypothetical protein
MDYGSSAATVELGNQEEDSCNEAGSPGISNHDGLCFALGGDLILMHLFLEVLSHQSNELCYSMEESGVEETYLVTYDGNTLE